jgi:ankyrin repeat protein
VWKDIVPLIAIHLDFISMISLKKTCILCNYTCDIETILKNSDFTASNIMSNEKIGEILLVRYAQSNNKKFFKRLWNVQRQEDKDNKMHAISLLYNFPMYDFHSITNAYKGKIENPADKAERVHNVRNNALKKVIYSGNNIATRLLLANKADPNIQLTMDFSLLHFAVRAGDANKTQLLIEYGANIHKKDGHDNVPLHIAAVAGNVQVVRILYKKGAIIDSCNYYNQTPLHKACENGHYKVVRYLLKKGANINQQDYGGDTPLNLASCKGWLRIVQLLLEKGALPTIGKDNRSNAYWYNHPAVAKLLDDYGIPPCLEERIIKKCIKYIPYFLFIGLFASAVI